MSVSSKKPYNFERTAGLAVVVVNLDVVLKLVVLNKDATFRLQTSTGLLNLAVLHKDTTLRLLIFFQGVKIAQDGRHSLLLFQ